MFDLRRMFVSHTVHAREQLLARERVAEPQRERGARELRRAHPLLRRRSDVREHDDRLFAQETPEDVHAPGGALRSLCHALHCIERIVQLRQLVDVRLREQRRQILLPRAQGFPPRRDDRHGARRPVIGGGERRVFERARAAVRGNLLRRCRKRLGEPAHAGVDA